MRPVYLYLTSYGVFPLLVVYLAVTSTLSFEHFLRAQRFTQPLKLLRSFHGRLPIIYRARTQRKKFKLVNIVTYFKYTNLHSGAWNCYISFLVSEVLRRFTAILYLLLFGSSLLQIHYLVIRIFNLIFSINAPESNENIN